MNEEKRGLKRSASHLGIENRNGKREKSTSPTPTPNKKPVAHYEVSIYFIA